MGPRPDGRGEVQVPGRHLTSRCASMGPRPDGRGERVIARTETHFAQLQWGRDLTVAESFEDTPKVGDVKLLQWGRDLTVAESSRTSPDIPMSSCFNGAAT